VDSKKERDRYFIGVDPGREPALCALDENGVILYNVLLKSKEGFPFYEYANLISDVVGTLPHPHIKVFATCELPHSVYGASAKSNFTFGLSVGACQQALISSGGIEATTTVSPKIWQKKVILPKDRIDNPEGKKDTKATALSAAKRILGDKWRDEDFLPTTRSKKVNHNMVDSFLIARYC